MIEGLWTVEFQTNMGGPGHGGVAVLRDGKVAGGDSGYYYVGTYSVDDGNIQTVLEIKRYRSGHVSIFGPVDRVHLALSGKTDGFSMDVSGQVAGIGVNVKGTKRETF